ncbi:endonuclease III [Clostridium oryzae]|uniref:Endonuclease III n=1 Tax=Clostridium oryzae TaxID=1450648 RepID=A0A1V4IIQ8_9CLOT|nr:endonuclease III [Clostridium oryzae]OPJ59377.1 endonuclease III [Clostridium oryzae]
MKNKTTTRNILETLYSIHPDACCALNYSTPFELLIATVLSAQTTDKKVNEVTSEMFKKYNTPEDFAALSQEELENEIRRIGLYKNKAKNIIGLSKELIRSFNSEVPHTHEQLMSLAGVGRKTANVVLSNAYGVPALAVDTHVFRVSNRIGLAHSNNVEETEKQLTSRIPKEQWIIAHHTLIFHGRRICKAQNPNCSECGIREMCDYYKKSTSHS